MKLNLLTVQEYKDLRYKLIKELEGSRPNPYKDSKKILTIGIGFNVDCSASSDDTDYSIYRKLLIMRKIGQFDRLKIDSFDDSNFTLLLKDGNYKAIYEMFINDTSAAIFTVIRDNRSMEMGQLQPKLNAAMNRFVDASNNAIAINKKGGGSADHISKQLAFVLNDNETKDLFDAIILAKEKGLKRALEDNNHVGIKFLTSFMADGKVSGDSLPGAKEYPQEFIPLLSNFYQQPAKFQSYKDSAAFLKHALKERESRFLTWFGIRYYLDRTAVNNDRDKNNRFTSERIKRTELYSRRIKEAAIFGIMNLTTYKEDAEKAKYEACLDIFTHLNAYFHEIRAKGNYGLSHYNGKEKTTTIYSYLLDEESKEIDKTAVDPKSALGEEARAYAVKKSHVGISGSPDGALDNSTIEDILKPFVEYINEKFASKFKEENQSAPEFSVDKIYVASNPNKLRLKAAILQNYAKHQEDQTTKDQPFKILIISTVIQNMQLRFDDILENHKQASVTLALENGKDKDANSEGNNNARKYYINAAAFENENFRILIYDLKNDKPENVSFLKGILEPENNDQTEGIIVYKPYMKHLEASFNTSTSILEIKYKNTFIYLLNYIPSKKQACIELSNTNKLSNNVNVNPQTGNIQVTVKFNLKTIKEEFTYESLNQKKYYMYVNDTDEIIDTKVDANDISASAKFQFNEDIDKKKNSKLIFSFNKQCLKSKTDAHEKGEDFCHINTSHRKNGELNVNFNINIFDTEYGRLTNVTIFDVIHAVSSDDNNNKTPSTKDYLDDTYTLKASYEFIENTNNIKWSYGLFTQAEIDSNSTGKAKQGKKEASLKDICKKGEKKGVTGEEISFTPSEILTSNEVSLLRKSAVTTEIKQNKDIYDIMEDIQDTYNENNCNKKLVVFAYLYKQAYKTDAGITHCVIKEQKTEEITE